MRRREQPVRSLAEIDEAIELLDVRYVAERRRLLRERDAAIVRATGEKLVAAFRPVAEALNEWARSPAVRRAVAIGRALDGRRD